ncbi:MAG: glycosyltransferase family 2 protein [Bacteroidota bacterium]
MYHDHQIAVIIPAYRSADHIEAVLKGIPQLVDQIVVVDDGCPEDSGKIAESFARSDQRIEVIFHSKNSGVGAAMITGYRKALDRESDILVKMDGDGQMDPQHLTQLLGPLVHNRAGYSKGNRFHDFNALRQMPGIRLMGNSLLSFLVKSCSGYWQIMDPANGYTAIRSEVLRRLNLDKIANRYFFETDMLIRLNVLNVPVADVPIPARYGDEKSSLSIRRHLISFPFLLFRGMVRRFVLKYLIYDFNMASVYVLAGLPMVAWGIIFGLYHWIVNAAAGIPTPTGTVMLAVLPLILGTQFLIAAINIDIESSPRVKD